MRNAETVLGVLRERGRRHWPLERVYRLLFNPELYLLFGVRQRLLQPGGDDAGRQRGNRRRHDRGQDRPDYRADAVRAVPVLPRPPHLYPEKEREAPSSGTAVVVR
jgi:hypothetical protein